MTRSSNPPAMPNLGELTTELLLKQYTPAAVLTNDQGDILYITGKTGKYLEPAVGKANLNLFAMAREGLGNPLHEAFYRALREKISVVLKAVQIGTNGGTQFIDLSVEPVSEPATLRGMMLVVFSDIPMPAPPAKGSKQVKLTADDNRLVALNKELQQSREELQTLREEMQSSQEELQSTNEELQSTNEELTTSKEEMQSMNEELQTVNQELQAKVDELLLVSDDMKNLLNSTEIATLFLDENLKVRRFTPQTASIIKLIPGDAGRPITDIVSELDYPELPAHARDVLRTLSAHEQQVSAQGGRWFKVRIMPYRTQDNRIDGVVIIFIDISETKEQEAYLAEALNALDCQIKPQQENQNKTEILEHAVQKARAVLAKLLKTQEQR